MKDKSYDIGFNFEKRVYSVLKERLENNLLGFFNNTSKIFIRKKYYSKTRKKKIEIDISIELTMPFSDSWNILWAWECKDYKKPVPAKEVEAFLSRIDGLGKKNILGGFAISKEIEESALNVANENGVLVIKLLDDNNFKTLNGFAGLASCACIGCFIGSSLVPFNLFGTLLSSKFTNNEKIEKKYIKEKSKSFYSINKKNEQISVYQIIDEIVNKFKLDTMGVIITKLKENIIPLIDNNLLDDTIIELNKLKLDFIVDKVKSDFNAIRFCNYNIKNWENQNYEPYNDKLLRELQVLVINDDKIKLLENKNHSYSTIKNLLINIYNEEKENISKLQIPVNYGFVDKIIYKEVNGNYEFSSPKSEYKNGITIPETYLKYLWLISYSCSVLFIEKKSTNDNNYNNVAENFLRLATEQMRNRRIDWHKNQPSPDIFQYIKINTFDYNFDYIFDYIIDNNKVNNIEYKEFEYIIFANIIFKYSLKFILYHEISHFKLGHNYKGWASEKYNKDRQIETIKKEEFWADEYAIDFILKNSSGLDLIKQKTGIIIGAFSNLFLSKNLIIETHPDNDERIANILKKLDIESNKFLEQFTHFLFALWFDFYHKDFSLQNSIDEEINITDFLNSMIKLKNT